MIAAQSMFAARTVPGDRWVVELAERPGLMGEAAAGHGAGLAAGVWGRQRRHAAAARVLRAWGCGIHAPERGPTAGPKRWHAGGLWAGLTVSLGAAGRRLYGTNEMTCWWTGQGWPSL